MKELIIKNYNGINVTDSREVAEIIGKKHQHIMRDIRGYIRVLEDSPKLDSRDFFIESTYQNSQNKTQPCYLLTKQGCEMVANKITGEKGILFTAEYVQAFNKMDKLIKNNPSINELEGQLTTMVNNLFEDKLKEVKEYYKINSKTKFDLSSYIKKRLGILRADDEYEQVKARVFLILGISKWEDLNVENYKDVLPVIDESIRIIKLDRPQQTSLWD
ncbi:Rha family transcriptional regulator [Clostridium butyricum]|uniref:Rha family transcriptional regulator n=2 Tax=Clostridium butyricum TaxID=1492 RepID=UPI002AB1FB9D|nr:Rha family transcriptional regulator [Clostridium butyricum]